MAEYYYVVATKIIGNKNDGNENYNRIKGNGHQKVKTIVAGPYPEHIAEEKVDETLGRSDIVNADVKSCPYSNLARATQTFKERKWSDSKDLDDATNRMGHQL